MDGELEAFAIRDTGDIFQYYAILSQGLNQTKNAFKFPQSSLLQNLLATVDYTLRKATKVVLLACDGVIQFPKCQH